MRRPLYLNRYTPRGMTAFKHLPEPKSKVRKCQWLQWVAITSPRYFLPRNPRHFNVSQFCIDRVTRKGAKL